MQSDKVAIVTGGTRGIGLGIAECLARDGFSLVLGYSSNAERAEQARAGLQERHSVRVQVVAGDIAEQSTINALFSAALKLVCEEDTWELAYVHNAGLTAPTAAKQQGLHYGEQFDARLYEYFQKVYCHSFRRAMDLGKASPGFTRAVAISSVGCNSCQNPTGLYYEAPGHAKASLEYLVRVYAKVLAKDGITVNAVIPMQGPIETEAWDDLVKATGMDLDKFIASTPAQRWAKPTEVGEAVAFLCSERAAFINGVALPIDGGLHLGRLE